MGERDSIQHMKSKFKLQQPRYIVIDNNLQGNVRHRQNGALSNRIYNVSTPGVSVSFKMPSRRRSTAIGANNSNTAIRKKYNRVFVTFNDMSASIIDLNSKKKLQSTAMKIRSIYTTVFGNDSQEIFCSGLITGIDAFSVTRSVIEGDTVKREATKQSVTGNVSTIRFVCSNNVHLPPIIVNCAGKIEEFASQLNTTYTHENEYIRKRALAFGTYMQRCASRLDKGRAGMTYLQARKGNDISTVLVMRQMLYDQQGSVSKWNDDVNRVALKLDASKLEQTLKDLNKSANEGNKRITWFCKISNVYWKTLRTQKFLRNLLSNYSGPTSFFSSITLNIKENMYLEVVSKNSKKNTMNQSYRYGSSGVTSNNMQQSGNEDEYAEKIVSLIIASTNIKATVSTKIQMLEKTNNSKKKSNDNVLKLILQKVNHTTTMLKSNDVKVCIMDVAAPLVQSSLQALRETEVNDETMMERMHHHHHHHYTDSNDVINNTTKKPTMNSNDNNGSSSIS